MSMEQACFGRPQGAALAGRIAFVLGTRPEIVKLAALIRLFADDAAVVHTGQHYDEQMSGAFFTDCGLAGPDVMLRIGGLSRAAQIGRAVHELGELFAEHRPAAVLVQGDTNSALAGALAANALEIPLVHVEAGLRSRDRAMPEEHNRVLIDHLADLLCAPTPENAANLRAEGIDERHIAVTGNTVVEALRAALPGPTARAKLLADIGVEAGRFVLATAHRPENTDDPRALRAIVTELAAIGAQGWPVVFPVHPRTRAALHAADGGALGTMPAGIIAREPLGYRDFLALAAECALLISDSGGIQEEATVLGRPLIVVRRSTERPEAMRDFATLVRPGPEIGAHATRLLADQPELTARLTTLPSPFGDGKAAARIHALTKVLIEEA
jgi:UDP-N-acetylglucosamine 2-epimerase (non-hydrolysing)